MRADAIPFYNNNHRSIQDYSRIVCIPCSCSLAVSLRHRLVSSRRRCILINIQLNRYKFSCLLCSDYHSYDLDQRLGATHALTHTYTRDTRTLLVHARACRAQAFVATHFWERYIVATRCERASTMNHSGIIRNQMMKKKKKSKLFKLNVQPYERERAVPNDVPPKNNHILCWAVAVSVCRCCCCCIGNAYVRRPRTTITRKQQQQQ